MSGIAEAIHERSPVFGRQLPGGGDRVVVERQGEPVLQEGADDGARQHATQLLDGVDDTGGETTEVCGQVARGDAEHRRPDEAHA